MSLKVFDTYAAFISGQHLLDVILESSQGSNLPGVDDHAFPKDTHLGVPFNLARI
jgi:hypothetical protein